MSIRKLLHILFLAATPLIASDPLLEPDALTSFKEIYSEEEIAEQIHALARSVDAVYSGEEIALVMLLKGAICVTTDLMRALQTPSTLDFIQASSYGANGCERGELTIVGLDRLDLEGKDVLVIDEIFDSGVTLATAVDKLLECKPKSLRSLVFIVKNVDRPTSYYPDFVGFEAEDLFLIGYGMDYKERWRDLPAIYAVD